MKTGLVMRFSSSVSMQRFGYLVVLLGLQVVLASQVHATGVSPCPATYIGRLQWSGSNLQMCDGTNWLGIPAYNGTGQLGIGQTNPNYLVDIYNTGGAGIRDASDSGMAQLRLETYGGAPVSSIFGFSSAGSMASPGQAPANLSGLAIFGGGADETGSMQKYGSIQIAPDGASPSSGSAPGVITFSTTTAGTTTPTEQMRITNAGYVGIGTNHPAMALDVRGNISAGTSVDGGDQTNPAYTWYKSPQTGMYLTHSTGIGFSTGGVEAMRYYQNQANSTVGSLCINCSNVNNTAGTTVVQVGPRMEIYNVTSAYSGPDILLHGGGDIASDANLWLAASGGDVNLATGGMYPGTGGARAQLHVDGATGYVGIGTGVGTPSSALQVAGAITVASCNGCSVIAEMMPIEGSIEEGSPVCIDSQTGKISKCQSDKSLTALGIATTHAEQLLRLGCSDSASKENHLVLGGTSVSEWRKTKACNGWFPVALTGVHEFVKVECTRADGTPLQFGDRLVTSGHRPGYVRPLSPKEQGGDAVLGKAFTACKAGNDVDVIHVQVK